jgi:hypothetical protein
VYSCNDGFVAQILSTRGLFIICIFAAVIYFGWPIFEAILITLPLPDPKNSLLTVAGWLTKIK